MLTGISELDQLIHSFNRFEPGTELLGYDHDLKHAMGHEVFLRGVANKHPSAKQLSPEAYRSQSCCIQHMEESQVQIDRLGKPYLEVYAFVEKTFEVETDSGCSLVHDSLWWEGWVSLYTIQDFEVIQDFDAIQVLGSLV